jgi:hypothetical protein
VRDQTAAMTSPIPIAIRMTPMMTASGAQRALCVGRGPGLLLALDAFAVEQADLAHPSDPAGLRRREPTRTVAG